MTMDPAHLNYGLAAIALVAGVVAGSLYFRLLRIGLERWLAGGQGRLAPVVNLARFGLVILLLAASAQAGALALLAAFAGFLAARHVMLRRAKAMLA